MRSFKTLTIAIPMMFMAATSLADVKLISDKADYISLHVEEKYTLGGSLICDVISFRLSGYFFGNDEVIFFHFTTNQKNFVLSCWKQLKKNNLN